MRGVLRERFRIGTTGVRKRVAVAEGTTVGEGPDDRIQFSEEIRGDVGPLRGHVVEEAIASASEHALNYPIVEGIAIDAARDVGQEPLKDGVDRRRRDEKGRRERERGREREARRTQRS
jgi:hypothetical protein